MTLSSLPAVKLPLSGWGRCGVVESYVHRPEKVAAVSQILGGDRSAIARGLGRSYGDAALNTSGSTVLMERLNRMLAFNPQTGVLRCEAGVTFKDILEVFVPRGWFPGVTPGTKFVTVGGAVACDVHGKNHHRDRAFSNVVRSLKLMLATGELVEISREQNPDLFWATLGGMGLTGIIIEVEFALRRIETAYINSCTLTAKNLQQALELFDEYEPHYRYSVAWIDCLAKGDALGRSILMLGNHATLSELDPQQRTNPFDYQPKRSFNLPCNGPAGLLNRMTIAAFNEFYYRRKSAVKENAIADIDTFFYPLDSLGNWNRLYGKPGFVQYQCVFPAQVSSQALTELLKLCGQEGWGSFLGVLKRFGPEDGLLSFPFPGYTLALDIAVKPGLYAFLDRLDRLVINYGGRVYLAKDIRLTPESFRKMYPRFPQWLEIKSRVDPNNRFTSVLSQRLQLSSR